MKNKWELVQSVQLWLSVILFKVCKSDTLKRLKPSDKRNKTEFSL